jgi:hypothetical protein
MRSDITANCRQRGPVPPRQPIHPAKTINPLEHVEEKTSFGATLGLIGDIARDRFPPVAVTAETDPLRILG